MSDENKVATITLAAWADAATWAEVQLRHGSTGDTRPKGAGVSVTVVGRPWVVADREWPVTELSWGADATDDTPENEMYWKWTGAGGAAVQPHHRGYGYGTGSRWYSMVPDAWAPSAAANRVLCYTAGYLCCDADPSELLDLTGCSGASEWSLSMLINDLVERGSVPIVTVSQLLTVAPTLRQCCLCVVTPDDSWQQAESSIRDAGACWMVPFRSSESDEGSHQCYGLAAGLAAAVLSAGDRMGEDQLRTNSEKISVLRAVSAGKHDHEGPASRQTTDHVPVMPFKRQPTPADLIGRGTSVPVDLGGISRRAARRTAAE